MIDVPGSRAALTTPALVLDLDMFERNLDTLADICGDAGIRRRPHAKTHKCSEIAKRQVTSGAVGICCATLHEAEILINAKVSGVIVTSPVIGAAKINRLLQAASQSDGLKVVVDNPGNVQDLADAANRAHLQIEVLIDIDVGMQRTGVNDIDGIVAMGRQIQQNGNLLYRGVQAYSGKVQHIERYAERKSAYEEQLRHLENIIAALNEAGLKPSIITGGGTGTYDIDMSMQLLTEHQTGSYIFMDAEYNAVELTEDNRPPFQTALFVQCAVVSNNAEGFVTIDGGYKCFATDGPAPIVATPDLAGATFERFGDEHGKIVLPEGVAKPAIGTPITLITPHCDPTVNLHNYYHCVRGDKLVDIWKIDARGVL